MDGKAVILTGGMLATDFAKTAHGLIRGTDRYQILGVVDTELAGKEAGSWLDGKDRAIPIFSNLTESRQKFGEAIDYCLIGIATIGGVIPEQLIPEIEEALHAGISIVNGLHQYLSDNPHWVKLAEASGAQLIDLRKPKKVHDLHFWSGSVMEINSPKVVCMGIDCAIGKRTTARILAEAARAEGLKAEIIYTGQTGWMQGGKYGFILDSTLNDFVAGELEHAMVKCYQEQDPDLIIIEGQASMRNPSGPCGAEFLVSGGVDGVILQFAPRRIYHEGWEKQELRIPSLISEIQLIQAYGVPVLAVSMNTQGLNSRESFRLGKRWEAQLEIPVVRPLEEGGKPLITALRAYFSQTDLFPF